MNEEATLYLSHKIENHSRGRTLFLMSRNCASQNQVGNMAPD